MTLTFFAERGMAGRSLMRIMIFTSLAYYAAAAAIVGSTENYAKAVRDNCYFRPGWPLFFAAVSILVIVFTI
jgi:hypothetical protein